MGTDYLFGNDFTPFEACHGRIYPGLLSGYQKTLINKGIQSDKRFFKCKE
jgi:hypothetical protein